jgi:hypothetical protein
MSDSITTELVSLSQQGVNEIVGRELKLYESKLVNLSSTFSEDKDTLELDKHHENRDKDEDVELILE